MDFENKFVISKVVGGELGEITEADIEHPDGET